MSPNRHVLASGGTAAAIWRSNSSLSSVSSLASRASGIVIQPCRSKRYRWASSNIGSPIVWPPGPQPRPSGFALEDRTSLVGIVDDKGEHRPVAPPPQEQVAVDVHARIRELPRQAGHAAGPIVDLRQDRLALDEGVAAFLENGARSVVVGGRHDDVARATDPAAADRPKVDP